MTARRFPRSPEITPRPFDGGQNPFADDVTTPIPISDNPLQAPVSDDVQPYLPSDYVQSLPDRSARVMFFGVVGAFFVGISLIIAAVVLSTALWSVELVYCFPADLVGLAFTIPAWMMASRDLRAVRAGAMDPSGLGRTRVGYWCGCIGTLIGIAPFVLAVMTIIGAMIG
jgi:hypothetical protein